MQAINFLAFVVFVVASVCFGRGMHTSPPERGALYVAGAIVLFVVSSSMVQF